MALLLLVLATIIALGKFVDFLLGDRGNRNLKDGLVRFYVRIAEGDWSDIFRWSAEKYRAFVSSYLAESMWSYRFFWATLVYSSVLTSIVYFSIAALDHRSLVLAAKYWLSQPLLWESYACLLTVNYVIDLVALAVLIGLLRSIAARSRAFWLLHLAVALIVTYALLGIAVQAARMMLSLTLSESIPLLVRFWSFFRLMANVDFVTMFNPFGSNAVFAFGNYHFYGLYLLNFSIAFPMVLYSTILAFAFLVYYTRPITQRPLSLLLERLEGAKSGLFTTLTSAVAVIIGILTAVRSVIGQ